MSTYRIDDPQLDFSVRDKFGESMVEVSIAGWCGMTRYQLNNLVPADYIGAPNWPHLIRCMKLDLLGMMMDKEPGAQRYTIRQQ